MKLPLVYSIDDLVLLLLNKPQYFFEILLKTSVANVLGIRYLSEAQMPYLLEQEDYQHYEERKRKLNEVILCVDDLQEQTNKLTRFLDLKNEEIVKLQEQTNKLAQLLEMKSQEVVILQELKEQLLIEKQDLITESSKNKDTMLELEKSQSVFKNNVLEIWNNLQNFK
jgi:DNA repair ATPase RecN